MNTVLIELLNKLRGFLIEAKDQRSFFALSMVTFVIVSAITGVMTNDPVISRIGLCIGFSLMLLAFILEVFPSIRNKPLTSQSSAANTVKLLSRSEFPSSLEQLLSEALPRKVSISGLSLLATFTTYGDCFFDLARQGVQLQFLLLMPDPVINEATMSAVERLRQLPVDISADILRTLTRFEALRAFDNVEIRFSQYAPTVSFLDIESDHQKDRIQVEIYGFGVTPGERPHFILHENDTPWFRYFKDQFKWLWNTANTLDALEPSLLGAGV